MNYPSTLNRNHYYLLEKRRIWLVYKGAITHMKSPPWNRQKPCAPESKSYDHLPAAVPLPRYGAGYRYARCPGTATTRNCREQELRHQQELRHPHLEQELPGTATPTSHRISYEQELREQELRHPHLIGYPTKPSAVLPY